MPEIYNLEQIKKVVEYIDVLGAVEEGFVAYSEGKVVVPPVGEMIFENPPGDVHIKYGYIRDDDYYVIKIASGFYDNPELGLMTGNGMMLLFSQKNGELVSILLDEAYLTEIRTAAAGAIAAKYLAPENIDCIGIYGTGSQGKLQLEYLKFVTECRDVIAWDLFFDKLDAYKNEMKQHGFKVKTTLNSEEVSENCNLIVMATPAKSPIIFADHIKKGTHITAMGSDTPEKQEVDPEILNMADIIVADSIKQCQLRGEIYQAKKAGKQIEEKIVELGNVIKNPDIHRTSEEQITIADLTGVAVQDIQITKAVYKALKKG